MIDLSEFTPAELLQLHTDIQKIDLLARIGIKPTDDEVLRVIDCEKPHAELNTLESQILYLLHSDDSIKQRSTKYDG